MPAASEQPSQEKAKPGERRLSGGGVISVEVRGLDRAEELTELALQAAGRAVLEAMERPNTEPPEEDAGRSIVGQSKAMRDLYRMIERISPSTATVLVTGENGTGKELVARTVHDLSKRKNRRFVATNCSAFNDNLLESELFGHKRGAFTGAVSDKQGLFEVADGGTFLLDEVGDMSAALQVKLLRVLQEGVFLPVGATEPRKVDVRIVAATNRDLSAMVNDGTFREDLYYRLHVVHLNVPPLRDRVDDVPVLAQHFLNALADRDGRHKSLTQETMDRLLAHRWPGNVRELENEIERLWVLSGDHALIGPEFLSPQLGNDAAVAETVPPSASSPSLDGLTLPEAIANLEERLIRDGLARAGGNKTRAAEMLGISRRNLIRKVQAYGLD